MTGQPGGGAPTGPAVARASRRPRSRWSTTRADTGPLASLVQHHTAPPAASVARPMPAARLAMRSTSSTVTPFRSTTSATPTTPAVRARVRRASRAARSWASAPAGRSRRARTGAPIGPSHRGREWQSTSTESAPSGGRSCRRCAVASTLPSRPDQRARSRRPDPWAAATWITRERTNTPSGADVRSSKRRLEHTPRRRREPRDHTIGRRRSDPPRARRIEQAQLDPGDAAAQANVHVVALADRRVGRAPTPPS